MERFVNALIKTKLFIPRPRHKTLARPALINQLNAGLNSSLILLSAQAGSGKTTLLVEWLGQVKLPAVWLSLDENDNEINRFLAYLVTTIQIAWPDFGETIIAAIRLAQPPPTESILAWLVNELVERREELIIVLDDYHVIKLETIHTAINFLIEHLPSQIHLVIATRSDPPLGLPRLRSRLWLTEVRSAQLRFSRSEAEEFLSEVMGLNLSSDMLALLEKRTEGWIVGLQLAGLSLRGASDPDGFVQAFSGSHLYILDYLIDEVLQRQPPEIQAFLLQTSILNRMSASLCDAVWKPQETPSQGIRSSEDCLAYINRNNLFLISLDDERRWFRYHHLFADLLRHQLARSMGNQVDDLHQRASCWFEQQGLISEALWHAIRANDYNRAADLIETRAHDLILQGYIVRIGEWLAAVPDDLVLARPLLSLYQAWYLVLTGEAQPVETYLSAVEHHLKGEPNNSQLLRETVAAIRAFMAGKTLDAPRAIEAAQNALAIISEENVFLRATAYYNLGVASLMVNDLPSACQALRESGRLGAMSHNLNVAVPSLTSLGVQEMALGRLHQAEKTFHEALQLAIDSDGHRLPLSMRPLAALSELHYEWNHLDLARQFAQEGCAQEGGWGNTAAATQAYQALCQVCLAQGDLSAAQTTCDKADEFVRFYHLPDWHDANAKRCRVRLWLHPGISNLAAALRWAEKEQEKININEPLPYLREVGNIAIARVWVAAGREKAALELLERLHTSTQDSGRVGAQIQIWVLQALARSGLGENQAALKILDQALALAEPEEYVRSIIDEGAGVAALLVEMVTRHQTAHLNYAIRLLSAMGYTVDPHTHTIQLSGVPAAGLTVAEAGSVGSLVEPLTEREMEVLVCLARGMTNSEIAGQLVVAVSTVKRHINHVFAKLGVTSRAKAIIEARKLGIL
ncbi:hypothetical protein ADN00_09070 [Ornatilinea apprima]|uniref:HTH luxR-type domain-containing protein n=1 Tax=Ornatilinea apprima TaxID=1134406 RepID=A0A0P6XUZ6_9CHLR|nr:LuxR C-terminal-related transcriptional regulator [Ornatilinea apprima]KPL77277.1 hypothetical protein ADN00_09070 [Ornatilinea apprima]